MRALVVLQSRLSSSRLPGKALLTLAGRPMVVLAAQRAGNAGHAVVVATSDRPEDDLVATACTDAGVPVARGPLDDPLARFVIAGADLDDGDAVVRLTADNVVPDGDVVEQLLRALAARTSAGEGRYVRLGGDDPSLPYGVAAEAFTAGALREADAAAGTAFEREHVTPYLREHEGDHRVALTGVRSAWAGQRCTVDTFDDYVALASALRPLADPVHADWRDLCDRVSADSGLRPPLPTRTTNPLGQGPLLLGTVQLGVAYGAANAGGLPDATRVGEVLAAARSERITHLDTARGYGSSEERIGAALRRGLSEHVGVVTKIAPLRDGQGADAAHASVEASLRALGTDRVAALLVHRAADWHRPGVAEVLDRLRSEGTAALVGASLATPAELVALLEDPRCGYVQLPFNLLDRRWLADEVQRALEARPDVVVTVRSVFLQGLLSAAGARWPALPGVDAAAVLAGVDEAVAALGRRSRADLCVAYALAHPWVTSVVVGAEHPDQVRDTAALVRAAPLSPREVDVVHARVEPGPPELVDPSVWS